MRISFRNWLIFIGLLKICLQKKKKQNWKETFQNLIISPQKEPNV